jgi:separase
VSKAQAIFESQVNNVSKESFQARITWERLAANAAYVQSRLHFAKGTIDHATFFAKNTVRLNNRIWARLDKLANKRCDKPVYDASASDIDTLADKMLTVSLCSEDSISKSYRSASMYWPHFSAHHNGLINLSLLSAHNGLFQDAIYFGEQALKVGKAVGANASVAFAQAHLGDQWIRGGYDQKGQELLDAAVEASKEFDMDVDVASINSCLSTLHKAQGRAEKETQVLDTAHKALLEISRMDFLEICYPFCAEAGSKCKLGQLSVESNSKPRNPPKSCRPRSRRIPKSTQVEQWRKDVTTSQDNNTTEFSIISRLRGDLLRQQTVSLLMSQRFDGAWVFLDEAERLPKSKLGHVSQRICRAQYLLADAIQRLSTHAVYCVIPESTISFPAIYSTARSTGECSLVSSSHYGNISSSAKRGKKPQASLRIRPHVPTEGFAELLSSAKDSLSDICSSAPLFCPTRDSHCISYLLCRISMLSYATTLKTGELPNLLKATYANGSLSRSNLPYGYGPNKL